MAMPSGTESIIEVGIALYIKQKYKLNLGYTIRDAEPGQLDETESPNNYYSGGVGRVIRRGDWFGVGLVATF